MGRKARVREREKACANCASTPPALYRCQLAPEQGWIFLCEPCLLSAKASEPATYRYGGTWKARKR